MKESKVILIVEDDKIIGDSIEYGLHHLIGTEYGIPLRMLRAVDPISAMAHINANHVDLMMLDINLANRTNGVEFAKELRKTYPYLPIIILTEKNGDRYKVAVHEQIQNDYFFTKPIEWEKVSSAVRRQLEAPVKPKPQFIPAIDASNGIYRHYREDFLFLQKIKNRMKIELFTLGATPNIPDEETISITKHQSFEKFAKYMISPEEKELLRCNDVTIVNANKIIKVSKIDHYLLLKGCEKKIPIDPAYRKHIYSMFRD